MNNETSSEVLEKTALLQKMRVICVNVSLYKGAVCRVRRRNL